MNNKDIIQKLFKIASQQQKIIMKLAQDANSKVAYLQRAADTALLNISPGTAVSAKVVEVNGKCEVNVKGLTANMKLQEAFKANLDRAVASQQPSLVGNYLVNFV